MKLQDFIWDVSYEVSLRFGDGLRIDPEFQLDDEGNMSLFPMKFHYGLRNNEWAPL